MSAPHAVISGASIAGLSAAWWLRRTGWEVTVVERAPSFRTGGQNVDVRGVAHEVLERMGLVDAVRAANTTETGTVLVRQDGSVRAELPSDGPDGATAELEVLRGDLARILLDDLPDGVEVLYGDTVAAVTDREDAVTVVTTGRRRFDADLLVVAEGVRSSTRDLVFTGPGDVDPRDLGVTMAFGTIPRTADDDDRWRWYTAVGGRQVHLRPDPYGTTRAILAYAGEDDLVDRGRGDLVDALRRRYEGVGWETDRVLEGFAATDDLYVDRLTQIRMPSWRRGRVALVGDAAWCVTPMGGGGASLALTSGYVLAASVAGAVDGAAVTRDIVTGPLDRATVERALTSFDDWMRPLVDDVQGIPDGMIRFAYPRSRVGLAARRAVDAVVLGTPLRKLAARITQVADTERPLPPLVTAS
ncbi:FAD-dependent monooxygenase [Curtobacterium sp. ER1/6]|uniref:FAD-dependent monooxygenase n=1 Tax=Curtobacterium sp. ER1/6 TaxID=1891920 RepID=UPI00084FAEA2|nr:FAD-dependent monooxygenase [Curtobacterium sp. ER1/6]